MSVDRKPAILADLDGTLALRGPGPDGSQREWFDFDRVGEDRPNWPVVNLVKDLHRYHNVVCNSDLAIIAISGRPNTCYVETEAWLHRHHIPHDALFMRDPAHVDGAGNMVADALIKEHIYREEIEPFYEVQFCLDDRDQVVAMWRSLGLTVFQAAFGAF